MTARCWAVVAATLAALLVLPAPAPAAPSRGAAVLINLFEFAFDTRLTGEQRAQLDAAARSAPPEAERELLETARQLDAEFAGMAAWLGDTRRKALRWVSEVAKSDPGAVPWRIVVRLQPDGIQRTRVGRW